VNLSNVIWDWVNSITYNKDNLLTKYEVNTYNPYLVNKSLSYYVDCVFYANEMNLHSSLKSEVQYLFYLNTIRKSKRYSKWSKKSLPVDLDCIKQYYDYTDSQAYEALNILTKEQIKFIKQQLELKK
jgi:hypothetical protein